MIATQENPVISDSEKALIDAMRKTERSISSAHGAFTFFGIFERDNLPNRWDLVVSASWLATGRRGINVIANYVARLPKEEAIRIARIVPFPTDKRSIQGFIETYSIVDKGVIVVWPTAVGSLETAGVLRGYILVSQKGTPVFRSDDLHE